MSGLWIGLWMVVALAQEPGSTSEPDPDDAEPGEREHQHGDRDHGQQVTEGRTAEEPVVGGSDEHPVVGERDRTRQHQHGEEEQPGRRARVDLRIGGERSR